MRNKSLNDQHINGLVFDAAREGLRKEASLAAMLEHFKHILQQKMPIKRSS